MSDSVVRRGVDTQVASTKPTSEFGDAKHPVLKSTTHRALVHLAAPGVKGRTVLVATLSGRVKGSWANQTISVQALSAGWTGSKANWNNQPGVRTGTATVATGALVDGDRFYVDITTLLQQVANGATHYGWRVITSSGVANRLYGFDSGVDSWTLTYELSPAPEKPTMLLPNGGAVSRAKPVVTCDFTDLGGESTEQASIQVQVDPLGAGGGAADFDSGEVATTTPELDLATTAYPGLAANASTQWRVRVKDTAGFWSDWSDWATWTYRVKPALVLDNPAAAVLYDPTTVITAHLASGTVLGWRVVIASGTDKTKIRYDSQKRGATGSASLSVTLPVKYNNQPVFVDDTSVWLNVRVWDRTDRQGTPGDPSYIETWVLVAFNDDIATPPNTVVATQVGSTPRISVSWVRSSTPDGWIVIRDGVIIARLDPDEVTQVSTTYTWVDDSATPYTAHTYRVKAVVNDKQTVYAQAAATITTRVEGIWILSGYGDVIIDTDDVDNFKMRDRRATYKTLGRQYDIDIVTGFEGISVDQIQGYLSKRKGQDPATTEPILMKVKGEPANSVRLVGANMNIPVLLRDLSVTPSSEFDPDRLRRHNVSFGFWQVGEFKVQV